MLFRSTDRFSALATWTLKQNISSTNCAFSSIIFPIPFHYFGFGDSDEEDYGFGGAVDRQLEVRLGHRRDGPVVLKERGPGLSVAVIFVLENYIPHRASRACHSKWVDDLILSAHQVFENVKHALCHET